MQTLFNYTTISTRLEKTTRTLFVTLNRPDWQNAFRLEMLFELESLFAWCTSKVEINTILIDSSTPLFSTGLEYEGLPTTSAQTLSKVNSKLQKIIFSMMQLPQTVIIDLGEGAETLASEFALGADLRMASRNAEIKFNHGHLGLVPAAGGMNMLSTLISPAFARTWILGGVPITKSGLTESGFLAHTYTNETRAELVSDILSGIAKLAPVQRIQAKLGLFEAVRSQLEAGIVMDRKIAKASMVSEDWRGRKPEIQESDFMPAKSMSYAVKLSLIKSDEAPRNLDH